VVNDVGVVHLCIPAPMVDPKAGLNLAAGCQDLNGDQALGLRAHQGDRPRRPGPGSTTSGRSSARC
jgi:anionic cell wall polymer biosynthesis LytR-Cps2A-Psr (LCP) family protein